MEFLDLAMVGVMASLISNYFLTLYYFRYNMQKVMVTVFKGMKLFVVLTSDVGIE